MDGCFVMLVGLLAILVAAFSIIAVGAFLSGVFGDRLWMDTPLDAVYDRAERLGERLGKKLRKEE